MVVGATDATVWAHFVPARHLAHGACSLVHDNLCERAVAARVGWAVSPASKLIAIRIGIKVWVPALRSPDGREKEREVSVVVEPVEMCSYERQGDRVPGDRRLEHPVREPRRDVVGVFFNVRVVFGECRYVPCQEDPTCACRQWLAGHLCQCQALRHG